MPHFRTIFIVGAGNVGKALGRRWLERGHDVAFGVPDPRDPKYADVPPQRVRDAADRRGADVVVLATPFGAARQALEALGDLRGVTLIDCTNPIGRGPDGMQLVHGHTTSGAEQIAAWAPGAAVFKTLNQTGAENMADAAAYHPAPVMFVAGDDAEKKPAVMELVHDLGFQAVDAGPLAASRLLEPLAMLWIELAMKRGHARDFAFALVHHPRSTHQGTSR